VRLLRRQDPGEGVEVVGGALTDAHGAGLRHVGEGHGVQPRRPVVAFPP
jgi:hypothetical protein